MTIGNDRSLSSLYSNMCSNLTNTVSFFHGSRVSNCTLFGRGLFNPEYCTIKKKKNNYNPNQNILNKKKMTKALIANKAASPAKFSNGIFIIYRLDMTFLNI